MPQREDDLKDQDKNGEDDVQERFAGVQQKAEQTQLPRGRGLPEPPKVEFTRPTLPQVDPLPPDRGLGARGPVGSSDLRGFGLASVAGIQLVLSILVGAGLGWLLDRFLIKPGPQAVPWGLVIGFFLGTIAGFMQVMRLVNQINKDG